MLPTRKPPPEQPQEPIPVTVTPEQLRQMWELVRREDRNWLYVLNQFLVNRSRESDPSPRVQLALDLAVIAVCERVGRICRSDLGLETSTDE